MIETRQDPVKGELTFDIGEEAFTLSMGVNALIALEGKLSLTAAQIGRLLQAKPSLSHLRAIFWAGLQEHHEGISEKEAGRLMQRVGMENVGLIIPAAFMIAWPDAAKSAGDANAPADPQLTTGTG